MHVDARSPEVIGSARDATDRDSCRRRAATGRCDARRDRLGSRDPAALQELHHLNKKYPHGLGKLGARDHTSGTPVTNFKRSTKLQKLAMSYKRGLDRDKDGIACEKA